MYIAKREIEKWAKLPWKSASGDPWGADIQNSAKKTFIEAETLAYYISPHNNIVYQF